MAGCAVALVLGAIAGPLPGRTAPPTRFAAEIDRLSEPGGTFDTDNLISNEQSYLEVMPALVAGGVAGGAYLGVGPDQNFSYIARIRPDVAYIIDIRRDNLLLHLLFKALFAEAGNRAEYLSLLTGRAPPEGVKRWNGATLEELIEYIDRTPPVEDADRERRLTARMSRFGVPLSAADYATVARFHRTFASRALALRFQSHGRPPQPYYPRYRDLLLATDAAGRQWNFLAAEPDFQFVRKLQAEDRLVPVVGDLGGTHALPAIAATLAARGERVSALYVSNVERYLGRAGYARYLDNLAELPRSARSVIIRSIFGGGPSASMVEPIDVMLARRQVERR
jgi:hypothetical protein